MKVYGSQGPILQQAKEKLNKKGPGESDFKKIMDQTLQTPEKGKGPDHLNPGMPAGGVQMLHGFEKIQSPIEGVDREQVVSTIQQTLDLVDFYAGKLSDPSLSAGGITPLVSHLEEKMEALRGMESVPGLPQKLRPIISDLVLTITPEVEKFKRGDYS